MIFEEKYFSISRSILPSQQLFNTKYFMQILKLHHRVKEKEEKNYWNIVKNLIRLKVEMTLLSFHPIPITPQGSIIQKRYINRIDWIRM